MKIGEIRKTRFSEPQTDFTKNPPKNGIKFVKKANRWLAYYWTMEGSKFVQKNNWFSTHEEAQDFLEEHAREEALKEL